MFGYVTANTKELSEQDKERYQAAYCGLCHTLGKRHGSLSRLTLNYDLTFLALFLTELYQEECGRHSGGCPSHPLKKHTYFTAPAFEYAADMNIALSYYNLLDDWQDDKNVAARAEAAFLTKSFRKITELYPRQCSAIANALRALGQMEQTNELNPDLPANCFGSLMAEIFVRAEDEYEPRLRQFGFALGKFIYLTDAMIDLKKDIKKQRYNPLITFNTASFRDILCLLMNDCVNAFEGFERLRQDSLLQNILYSGVWLKFEMYQAKENKKKEKHK